MLPVIRPRSTKYARSQTAPTADSPLRGQVPVSAFVFVEKRENRRVVLAFRPCGRSSPGFGVRTAGHTIIPSDGPVVFEQIRLHVKR